MRTEHENDDDLDRWLAAADPAPLAPATPRPSPAALRLKETIMNDTVRSPRPTRPRRRPPLLVPVAALAAAAAVAAGLWWAGLPGRGDAGVTLVPAPGAEAPGYPTAPEPDPSQPIAGPPQLFPSGSQWTMTRFQHTGTDDAASGEWVAGDGSVVVTLRWSPPGQLAVEGPPKYEPVAPAVDVVGVPVVPHFYADGEGNDSERADEWRMNWDAYGYSMELDVRPEGPVVDDPPTNVPGEDPSVSTVAPSTLLTTQEQVRDVMASLTWTGYGTWIALMPASVVLPDDRPAVVTQMLADVPLPPGLDQAPLLTGNGAPNERYAIGVEVSGAVFCEWMAVWGQALDAGDETRTAEAAAAIATSRDWQVLAELDAEGGWSSTVWQEAAAVAAGDPGVIDRYAEELGCP